MPDVANGLPFAALLGDQMAELGLRGWAGTIHLQAAAVDQPKPLHVRVVQHARRLSKPRGQGLGELKPLPRRCPKMRGSGNGTATHEAGKTNRNTVELRQWS